MTPARALRLIKVVHTAVWAFFVAVILAIPGLAWRGRYAFAAGCAAIVAVEGVVLVANGWRCPLTDLAARHTPDRRDNFDIYLPLWLARHNKTVFTTIYAAGVLLAAGWWLGLLPR